MEIFSGNGNMAFALEISFNLGTNFGKSTGSCFADSAMNYMIHKHVRGEDVYVKKKSISTIAYSRGSQWNSSMNMINKSYWLIENRVRTNNIHNYFSEDVF